jgi:2-polyprenyl-3-methyl-5-hydroxy-6-metoxy-1,4-benzoquinol methylase
MLKIIIYSLRWLNLANYYWSKLIDRFYPVSAWTKELARYFKTKPKKILAAYLKKQPQANNLWQQKSRKNLAAIFSFYRETDYFIYRQCFYNQFTAWWELAWLMSQRSKGRLLEYGAGIGPVTNWLIKRLPEWNYVLVDLDCPVSRFSRWRFRHYPQVSFETVKSLKPPINGKFDLIIARNVLEHIPNPYTVVQTMINHLVPGGWLMADFIDSPGGENLASSYRERNKTLLLLKTKLKPIFNIYSDGKDAGYGLYYR